MGGLQPSFAIIVAEILSDYSRYACGINGNPSPPPGIMSKSVCAETLMRNLNRWSVVLVSIGVVHLLGYVVSCYAFGKSGEIMTMRLRSKVFAKYLSLEMSYFDEPENSTGALTTRLATDASKVKGATGTKAEFEKTIVFNSCFLENSENFLNFATSSKKLGEFLNFL